MAVITDCVKFQPSLMSQTVDIFKKPPFYDRLRQSFVLVLQYVPNMCQQEKSKKLTVFIFKMC